MISYRRSSSTKRIAGLLRKKDRLAARRFIVEGPNAVRELLTHDRDIVQKVYIADGAGAWQNELEALASESGITPCRVTDTVLSAMSDTVHPQGVIAVARIEEPNIAEVLAEAKLVAVLHDVRDPGNAGTVLRAADAAGADAVIFSGRSIDPWHPKVVRATTGSLFHLPVVMMRDLEDAIEAVKRAGLITIAADVRGLLLTGSEQKDLLIQPHAWVFGNEAHGLTDAERGLADAMVRLPMYGYAESLNLATAASVLLYAAAFAQRAR